MNFSLPMIPNFLCLVRNQRPRAGTKSHPRWEPNETGAHEPQEVGKCSLFFLPAQDGTLGGSSSASSFGRSSFLGCSRPQIDGGGARAWERAIDPGSGAGPGSGPGTVGLGTGADGSGGLGIGSEGEGLGGGEGTGGGEGGRGGVSECCVTSAG